MKRCEACAGRLERKNEYTYQCPYCGREYYESVDRTHKLSLRIGGVKVIAVLAVVLVVFISVGLGFYQAYTIKLTKAASRFSEAFKQFLTEIYDKPVVSITEEDISKIKYLKIEKDGGYLFSYSFEDYDSYGEEAFWETVHEVSVDVSKEDFSPSNVQYFSGLTRLELLTGAWQNYFLPEQNEIRTIVCAGGVSNYGRSDFWKRVNHDTLEEVVILNTASSEDWSFLEELYGIRRLTLEHVIIKDKDMLKGFEELEELSLFFVDAKEEKAYPIMEEILSLPSLQKLTVSGRMGYYLSEDAWKELGEAYPDVEIVRQ